MDRGVEALFCHRTHRNPHERIMLSIASGVRGGWPEAATDVPSTPRRFERVMRKVKRRRRSQQ